MRSVELFAGAGGLALGMSNAGFQHTAVIEWDHGACETFRENQKNHVRSIGKWPLYEQDVRKFNYRNLSNVLVVSGGPPCQPFSLGGKHGGYQDKRDMFPEAVRAVRELRPQAFIFENVKGLMRETFSDYFEYVQLQLTHPDIVRRKPETWREHRVRLEQHHTSRQSRSEYNVIFRLLNAADYGVPQRRERVFLVGFRSDLGVHWSFPDGSYSEDAMLYSQWVTNEYWERHEIAKRQRPRLLKRTTQLERFRQKGIFEKRPWRTVLDAIADMPDPEEFPRNRFANHAYVPGARSYVGHTGSPLDYPSKTLKAGAHGVPGGENMLARRDGTVRYFSVREAARLQTFPDDFVFNGSWGDAMRQLGNAVPVQLAEVVAASVAQTLLGARVGN